MIEFLELKPDTHVYESDIEQALIDHLQQFLLELGRGFSFVSRQKRFTLDGQDFFIDLVFYNYILKCFILFDLKTGTLTHQDLGQMQMYVNYYTREMMNPGDTPPIGIVLCAEKNDAVVKYTLPENNQQIFASKYLPYLPTEEELKRELRLDEFHKKRNDGKRFALKKAPSQRPDPTAMITPPAPSPLTENAAPSGRMKETASLSGAQKTQATGCPLRASTIWPVCRRKSRYASKSMLRVRIAAACTGPT